MSAKRENGLGATCERLRAVGAFAGGTPAVAANHLKGITCSVLPSAFIATSRNIPANEKIQLANLGGVSAKPLRVYQLLPLICEDSYHPRFPLGQPAAVRSSSSAHVFGTAARVCLRSRPPTAIEDRRRSACYPQRRGSRPFCFYSFHLGALAAGFSWRPASGAAGAGLHAR